VTAARRSPGVSTSAPIEGIPIVDEADPRFVQEREPGRWPHTQAQALHSADELIEGMSDPVWRVRHDSVDRLVAHARNDVGTPPTLVLAATADEA
jgi:hypothetical protein